jgi:protein TonB
MSTERRQQARKVPKDFTYIRVGEDSGGRVLNVSEEGLCFEALSPIRYTESFPFWLSFNLIDRIDGEGTVVWVDTAKRTAGIRFMELSEFSREQIRAWMNGTVTEEAALNMEGTEVIELPLGGSETEELPVSKWETRESASRPGLANVAQTPDEPALSSEDTTAGEDSREEWESLPAREESSELSELVPLRRHLTAARMQFVRGILVGVGVGAIIVLPLFKYMSMRQKDAVEIPGATTTVSAGSLTEARGSRPVLEVPKPLSVTPTPAGNKSRAGGTSASRGNSGEPLGGRQPLAAPANSPGPQAESVARREANSATNTQGAPGAAPSNAVSGGESARPPVQTTPPTNREVQRAVEDGATVTASTVAATPAVGTAAGSAEVRRGNAAQPPPLGGDVRPPKLIKSNTPPYPALARTQRVSGDVQLDALVDTTGKVGDVKIVSGPLLLQRAAAEAIRQWKYAPGMLDGVATPMHVTVVLKFRIPNQ